MSEFNKNINKLNTEFEGRDEDSRPEEFFKRVFAELEERFDILNNENAFPDAKLHLMTVVKTSSGLTEEQQDTLATQVNELDDYARLLLFLDQQMKGL